MSCKCEWTLSLIVYRSMYFSFCVSHNFLTLDIRQGVKSLIHRWRRWKLSHATNHFNCELVWFLFFKNQIIRDSWFIVEGVQNMQWDWQMAWRLDQLHGLLRPGPSSSVGEHAERCARRFTKSGSKQLCMNLKSLIVLLF